MKGYENVINIRWNGTFSKRTRNTDNCIRTCIYRYCDFGLEKETIKSIKKYGHKIARLIRTIYVKLKNDS